MTTALITLVAILIVVVVYLLIEGGRADCQIAALHSQLCDCASKSAITAEISRQTANAKADLVHEVAVLTKVNADITERLHRAERTVERIRAAMSDECDQLDTEDTVGFFVDSTRYSPTRKD